MSPTIKILFEDSHLIVVDKPSGMHSVRNENSSDAVPTLSDLISQQFPETRQASEFPGDGGLIQRLDFGTSGCIIAARSPAVWKTLREMLKLGQIKKTYLVLLEGAFESAKEVNTYIGSPNRGAPKVRVFTEKPRRKDRALPATSHFEPLRRVANDAASLCRITAPTARRHQIRAHAGYLGFPLVGDSLYGSTTSLDSIIKTSLPGGFFLHAENCVFLHPITKQNISIQSALPIQI